MLKVGIIVNAVTEFEMPYWICTLLHWILLQFNLIVFLQGLTMEIPFDLRAGKHL